AEHEQGAVRRAVVDDVGLLAVQHEGAALGNVGDPAARLDGRRPGDDDGQLDLRVAVGGAARPGRYGVPHCVEWQAVAEGVLFPSGHGDITYEVGVRRRIVEHPHSWIPSLEPCIPLVSLVRRTTVRPLMRAPGPAPRYRIGGENVVIRAKYG